MFRIRAAICITAFLICSGQLCANDVVLDAKGAPRQVAPWCAEELAAAGLAMTDPITPIVQFLKVEPKRVLPAVIAILRDDRAIGRKNLLELSPAETEAYDKVDTLETQVWVNHSYTRTDIPVLALDKPPKFLGPDWTPESVQEVIIDGEVGIYRPILITHPMEMQNFINAKTKATFATANLAEYIFGKDNRTPQARLVRIGNEVGVLTNKLKGVERPSNSRAELRALDPYSFDSMVIFNFLLNTYDLWWESIKIQGETETRTGWTGTFLIEEKYTVVFDYNISPKPGFTAYSERQLMGAILPEDYPSDVLERVRVLNLDMLLSFGFTTRDAEWILLYRAVILKDAATPRKSSK